MRRRTGVRDLNARDLPTRFGQHRRKEGQMTLLLSNEEIDGLLDVSMVLDAVERSQRAVVAWEAVSSPRTDTLAPTTSGEGPATYGLKTMCGLWPEAGVAALRINSDVLVWPTVAGSVRRD